MTPELEEKLESCPSLPSPTTLAVQIITLANEPEIDLDSFIKVLHCDPALASKILRIANSPVYPYSKKVENLHQAVMILGLNATVSLALSFSLIKSLQSSQVSGLNYTLYWKRALLSGTICRILGNFCGLNQIEELHLSSLIQDLGMLALDQVFPDLYTSPTLNQHCHANIIAHEEQTLGVNHAAVGSWLLTQWNFPDRIRLAVAGSDDLSRVPSQDERARFVHCVSLSGKIAEIFIHDSQSDYLQALKEEAQTKLHLPAEILMDVLEKTKDHIPETEKIFQTNIQTWTDTQEILEKAREALVLRSLQTLKENQELQTDKATMEAQFQNLEETHRHDRLTGTVTRNYLDQSLEFSFNQALAQGEPLTLVFGDLDNFKSVNDTYGHQAGDAILQTSARLLLSKVRATDIVGRYGGEEFVLILPKTSSTDAEFVCKRILAAFRTTSHEISKDQHLTITISLGIASHTQEHPFSNVIELLRAADEALYYSKTHGRNQSTFYDTMPKEQSV